MHASVDSVILVAYSATSHRLNQRGLIANGFHRNKLQWNLNQNTKTRKCMWKFLPFWSYQYARERNGLPSVIFLSVSCNEKRRYIRNILSLAKTLLRKLTYDSIFSHNRNWHINKAKSLSRKAPGNVRYPRKWLIRCVFESHSSMWIMYCKSRSTWTPYIHSRPGIEIFKNSNNVTKQM